MSKTKKLALAAAIPVLLLAGCSDFLKGPGLSNNPNKPVNASPYQLFVGMEVAVMAQWENYPLMLFQTWSQQIAGVNRQWQTYADYDPSGTTQGTAEGAWNQTYGPGGLRDIKLIIDSLDTHGAVHWRGEVRVLEALYMGTAADIWGDVPFSDAFTPGNFTPTFDTQAQVYTHVQALLDSAITDLQSTDAYLPTTDFFYDNDRVLWTRAAHTLKARFYMHTAPTGATTYDNAILTSVVTEATAGIQAGGDLIPVHTSTPGEQNLFYSFQFSRAGDVAPAATHINIIKQQAADAYLLPMYYTPNAYGNYYGSAAGIPGDPVAGTKADSVAGFEVAGDPQAAWGIVTYVENQMLLAEAQFRLGNQALALTTLNGVRPAPITPAPVGNAILADILREKFIRDFFNMESWNDYLRTCYPNIPQPVGVDPTVGYVPARLPVGQTEQSANPNVPQQPSGNPVNANNYPHTVGVDGVAACIGQLNQPPKP